jgi:hypothetical protein
MFLLNLLHCATVTEKDMSSGVTGPQRKTHMELTESQPTAWSQTHTTGSLEQSCPSQLQTCEQEK